MFIVVSTSCKDCASQGVGVFEKPPSKEEIDKVEQAIGGMYCIYSQIYEVKEFGDVAPDSIEAV